MLVDEVGCRVPAAELVDAGQALCVFLLIDCVLQFAHPQRAARKTERRAVAIANLRQVVAVGASRVAGEHRILPGDLLGRLDRDAHAGRRQRKGWPAAEHVGGDKACPAEGTVEQVGRGRAVEEFVVRRNLPHADRNLVVEQTLLEPGGEQPRRRQRVDVADVADAAGVVGGDAASVVQLINREVRGGAFPAEQFVEVGVDGEFKAAFIARLTIQAAGQDAHDLVDRDQRDVDAFVLERGARAAPIAGQRVLIPDRGRLFRLVFSLCASRCENDRCRSPRKKTAYYCNAVAPHDSPHFYVKLSLLQCRVIWNSRVQSAAAPPWHARRARPD